MQKLIGIVCIIVAGAGFGYQKGMGLVKELRELRELQRIFLMLRSEVEYANAPLGEAFSHMADRISGFGREWLLFLAENVKKRMGSSFQTVWEQSIERELPALHLKRKNLELLQNMGTNLGYYDRTMQISAIDLYLEQLGLEIRTMQEEIPEKRRIWNCLGVMGGIFIAVVLI